MSRIASLDQSTVARLGVAGSEDRLPFVVVDGANIADAYQVIAADNAATLTYKVIDPTPTANESFDISVTGNNIVVTLASTTGAVSTKEILSDTDDNSGVLTLNSLVMGTAQNGATGGLKVEILDDAANDADLVCIMAGTGFKTLSIRLGKTGASTDSAKNTVTAIGAAIDAIVTNKKIDAVVTGTGSKKITVAAVAANFTGGVNSVLTAQTAQELVDELNDSITWTDMVGVATAALFTRDAESVIDESANNGSGQVAGFPQTAFSNPSLTGDSVDTMGFTDAMVVLSLGSFSPIATLYVQIQHSEDDVTFEDLEGANFGTVLAPLTYLDERTVQVGRLKLKGNGTKRYLKVVSTLTPDDQIEYAEHSVVFVFTGTQYLAQDENDAKFTI